jgi:hypothetical protein
MYFAQTYAHEYGEVTPISGTHIDQIHTWSQLEACNRNRLSFAELALIVKRFLLLVKFKKI